MDEDNGVLYPHSFFSKAANLRFLLVGSLFLMFSVFWPWLSLVMCCFLTSSGKCLKDRKKEKKIVLQTKPEKNSFDLIVTYKCSRKLKGTNFSVLTIPVVPAV